MTVGDLEFKLSVKGEDDVTDAMEEIRDSVLGAKKAVDALNGEDVDVDAEGEREVDALKDKLLSAARAAGRLDGKTVEIEAEVDADRARQALQSLRGGDADISGTSSPSTSRRRGPTRLPGELDEIREAVTLFGRLSPQIKALSGALVAAAGALGAAGGLAAAATALATRLGDAEIREDLARLKQRFRSLGAAFVESFEPVIRNSIIPAGIALSQSLREAIPSLKEFTQKNLPSLVRAVQGLIKGTVATIQSLGAVNRVLSAVVSAFQALSDSVDIFGEDGSFAPEIKGVRTEINDVLQSFGFGGETVAGLDVPQSEVSSILEKLNAGEISIQGPDEITAPSKIRELQTEIEKAKIKFRELGVTSKREFLDALVTIRKKGVDALAAVQARTGEVPEQLSKWSEELKSAQKRLDDFAVTAEDLNIPEVDLSGAGGPVEPPNPPEVVSPSEVTGAPSATEGGALPPLERIRKKIRQSVKGLSQVQQVGLGAFQSLGNSVGRVVGQILTLSNGINSVGDAFRSLGRSAVRIIQQLITKLASAAAIAVILGPALGLSSASFGSIFKGVLSGNGIPGLAQGGIVTGPTLGMIGEGREDEAILPLSKLNSMMSAVAQTASVGAPSGAAGGSIGVRQSGPSSTSLESSTLNVEIPVETVANATRVGNRNQDRVGRSVR